MAAILILFCLLAGNSYSQYKLLNYEENGNNILLKLELDKCRLNYVDENRDIKPAGYFDESLPGEYSLPSKEIFIGIPADYKIINFTGIILKDTVFTYNLSPNPAVMRINDSTVHYDFSLNQPLQSSKDELLQLRGYLWIDNIYTVHLSLKQYSYNELFRRVTEISEIEIRIALDKPLFMQILNENIIPYSQQSILINHNYAQNYKKRAIKKLFDSSGSWIDYSREYIRIKTAEDDIYRISYNDLQQLNITAAAINPSSFNIYMDGKTVPIYVKGEENGLFEPGEYIEFTGCKKLSGVHREISSEGDRYKEYTGQYSDTSVYWLTWNDNNPDRILLSQGILPFPADTLLYYTEVLHVEQNNWFDFSTPEIISRELPFWTENKTWGWTAAGVGVKSFNFNITGRYPGSHITLYCKLQSYASMISENAHLIGMGLNNDPSVFDLSFLNKYEQKVLSASLLSDSLVNGPNKFKLHSSPTASEINSVFFDWFEVEYPRYLKAEQGYLNFRFGQISQSSLRRVIIDSLYSNDYIIWKTGAVPEKYVSYNYLNNSLAFTDTISAQDKFILKAEQEIRAPALEGIKKFVNLRDSTRQGDYLIVTSDYFFSKAEEYKIFIQKNYNVKAVVINIQDIYDEFSFGNFNPEALKDFVACTNLWQVPAPRYLFLIGDANYDYHGNKHKYQGAPGKKNVVPSFGAPVSDNWFAIYDTTGAFIPQLNIGRLPVSTIAELDHYFNKHKNYLNEPYDSWNKKYIFFSGGPGDDIQQLGQLKRVHDSIITSIIAPAPVGGKYKHFYKTVNPVTSFGPYTNHEFQNAIDSSALLISYLGHSGTQTWDNSIVDPGQLKSSFNISPLITDFGCSTGKFAEPDIVSFSELFTVDTKGEAIAYIGNSSLGFISTSTIYPGIFYKNLLLDSVFNISEAHKLAKIEMMQTYGASGVYKLFSFTNTFFGDPILNLAVPPKPNIKILNVTYEDPYPSDDKNYLIVNVELRNTGKVTDAALQIRVVDLFRSEINLDTILSAQMPYYDSLIQIKIPVKDKAGLHTLKIILDEPNLIEEIYEDDNYIIIDFRVSSSALRLLTDYWYECSIKDTITFINPSKLDKDTRFEVDISFNEEMSPYQRVTLLPDTFVTYLDLKRVSGTGRRWIRGKVKGSDAYSFTSSLNIGTGCKYVADDSVAFNKYDLNRLSTAGDKISVGFDSIEFKVISAGLHDGKTAVISRNGENFVPMGNVIGHHVCIFDADDYEFVTYKKFNVFGGGPSIISDYYTFLDSLDEKYLVMIAISDEGRITVDSLKEKLHEFGSLFIDSLSFRSSWGFIGRRGSAVGSVPEIYHEAYKGRVEIDTTCGFLSRFGTFTTSLIGPAEKWTHLQMETNEPPGSKIKTRILAMRDDLSFDTLIYYSSDSLIQSLIGLNCRYIKLNGHLISGNSSIPEISGIFIDYVSPAELGTNSQGVEISDTINAGEINTITYFVTNAGETDADSFYVLVEVLDITSNKREVVSKELITKLEPGKRVVLTSGYSAGESKGIMMYTIHIDPENKIRERYKDNNFFSETFYVRADTSAPVIKILSDGNEIIDGDYISSTPEFKIEMFDESALPISYPSSLVLYLDEYVVLSDSISYFFNDIPKITAIYKPSLTNGFHKLKVFAKDASGNINTMENTEVTFIVNGKLDLMDIYNFPNPFQEETYFTFKLSQIPDYLKINIYTVAGTLIRKIYLDETDLKFGFNAIRWDGGDEDGNEIANGVYFYKISTSDGETIKAATGKMAKVK